MIPPLINRPLSFTIICLFVAPGSYGMDALCNHSNQTICNEKIAYDSIIKENKDYWINLEAAQSRTLHPAPVSTPVCAGIVPKTAASLKSPKKSNTITIFERREQRLLLAQRYSNNFLLDFLKNPKVDFDN